jgi:hypothetical protein
MKLEDLADAVALHEILESKKEDKLAVLDYMRKHYEGSNVLILSSKRDELCDWFEWSKEHVDSILMEMLSYPEVAEFINGIVDFDMGDDEFLSDKEDEEEKEEEEVDENKQCWFDAAAILFIIGAFSVVNVALSSYIIFKIGEDSRV